MLLEKLNIPSVLLMLLNSKYFLNNTLLKLNEVDKIISLFSSGLSLFSFLLLNRNEFISNFSLELNRFPFIFNDLIVFVFENIRESILQL